MGRVGVWYADDGYLGMEKDILFEIVQLATCYVMW